VLARAVPTPTEPAAAAMATMRMRGFRILGMQGPRCGWPGLYLTIWPTLPDGSVAAVSRL
jgi:hypothetical protein